MDDVLAPLVMQATNGSPPPKPIKKDSVHHCRNLVFQNVPDLLKDPKEWNLLPIPGFPNVVMGSDWGELPFVGSFGGFGSLESNRGTPAGEAGRSTVCAEPRGRALVWKIETTVYAWRVRGTYSN